MSEAQDPSSSKDRIEGVFSITKTAKVGTGATTRRVKQLAYYFVVELDDGGIEIQALNADGLPFGPKSRLSREKLLSDYLPEPEIYQKQVLPKVREIQKALARGDKFRKRGETFTAEYEYSKALKFDEANVRANFGIGLCYIARGDKAKAHEVFDRVVKLEAAFGDENKHLFNEFGISLRRSGMVEEAVAYYQKALDLCRDDENLHYNMARALFDKGERKAAAEHLKACLRLNSGHAEAQAFIAHLKAKGGA
ncbi:MAG: tetratricopeptide repeat protein [Desulfovibrionaceae bacterium]|nr:tetratricopeptide repeat protein [Desulfovibrionaceae bacterium]